MADRVIPDSREAQAVIEQLIQKWRANADLIAEDNKGEYGSDAAAMQRACANDLAALLADVLGSPTLQDQKNQEDTRVDRQCDPTDSPTASEAASVSTTMPGARKVTDAELAPFKKAMEEEVIPSIVESVHRRAVSAAESRNKVIFRGPPQTVEELRIALETEQTLKAAWEKRAYEAEAALTASAEGSIPSPTPSGTPTP